MGYKVAVVILNYQSWEDTLEEIKVCNQILNIKNSDIIIIDNFSPNDSAEKLKEKSISDKFVFIESSQNSGYGAGNNIGLKYAFNKGYTHALILNNDIIINNSNLISELLRVFKAEENAAVVNPDVYSPDGYLFNRDAVKPSFFDYTIGLLHYKKKGRIVNDIDGYGYIYRPQGCCMMVDLNKMNEVNYFDENTFLYYEEPILAEKFLAKGYRCICNTSISIIHNHSKTVKSTYDKEKIIKINNKSFAYYLKKYRKFNELEIKLCCMFNSWKLRKIDT